MDARTTVLVKVETDTGEYGIGEIWNNFPSWGVYEKVTTLKHGITPLLIGEDPLDIGEINAKLFRALTVLGLQWGALGPIYQSISGIDMALWDLKGKHMGKPVAQLLGGHDRQPVQVYASGIGPGEIENLIESHQEMGVSAFKLKVGKNDEQDFRNLQKMRGMLQPDDKIMIDANQAWDRENAIRNLQRFKAFNLTWIEEPLRCDDFNGYRFVRESTGIPVAAGENLYGERHARMALENRALDIIQPDLSKNGGISECRAMADIARSADVPFAPHFLGGAVCLAASLHFFSAVPGGVLLELDANPNPFREKLFTTPFVVKDGKLAVPQGPGLGMELDPEFVEHYRIDVSSLG
ncbi:D-galactarolactone cycloisomerase [Paenibacillus allorhizosphaerae]|uniref:D-galactarolactone cycloisomerase n=2 Tax=Paenibacillus allorhizosphaerae TaxID=2849866 RepID=A0ABN7TF36_9BACL|nr:D-galactarolactone cycloisomerase [Paenibacillus allorhizosphaerae]